MIPLIMTQCCKLPEDKSRSTKKRRFLASREFALCVPGIRLGGAQLSRLVLNV